MLADVIPAVTSYAQPATLQSESRRVDSLTGTTRCNISQPVAVRIDRPARRFRRPWSPLVGRCVRVTHRDPISIDWDGRTDARAASPLGRGPAWVLPALLPTTVLAGSPPSHTSSSQSPYHAIKHIIFIIKENRTFDSMFGTFPGANGATTYRAPDGTVHKLTTCRM